MLSITPCRTQISDRFPVASFVVRVPSEQSFEVACATDPDLFRPDRVTERTERNFFTTRFGGLLRAPAGEATIILPPNQLKNFAGSNRIYYALGAYGGADSEQGRFTLRPDRLDEIPYVQLAQDFTGRTLNRLSSAAVESPSAEYGGRSKVLTWGGDLFAASVDSGDGRNGNGYDNGHDNGYNDSYDDGYGSELWRQVDDYRHARGTDVASIAEPPAGDELPSSYLGTDPDAYQSDEYDSAPNSESEYWPTDDYGGGEPEGSEHAVKSYGYGGYGGFDDHDPTEPEGLDDTYGLTEEAKFQAPYGGQGEPEGNEEPEPVWGGGQDVVPEPSDHEPPGYEDVSELLASGMQLQSLPDEPVHGGRQPYGDSDSYDSSYGNRDGNGYGSVYDHSHAAPSPPSASQPSGILLGPREMTRIVRPIFKLNGGMDAYGKVDSDGRGLVWGMVGFNQRDGSLREVLHAARRRDQQWYANTGESVFEKVFGAQGAHDILRYMDRAAPSEWMEQVGGESLDQASWAERFRKAGACHRPEVSGLALEPERDPFKVAQNEIAITRHLVPALPVARALGFNTDRSLAMLYDRIVDMGHDAAGRWISESLSAVSPTTEVKGKLLHLVNTAERQARPWSHRLRAVYDNTTDLYDTIYRLDEV